MCDERTIGGGDEGLIKRNFMDRIIHSSIVGYERGNRLFELTINSSSWDYNYILCRLCLVGYLYYSPWYYNCSRE